MPSSRHITAGNPARRKLLEGACLLAKAVAKTYGPRGRTALLDRQAGLLATKDGVTVAREVDLPDPGQNMGAQMLKEACIQVNNDVGDGTSTVAVLTAALLQQGHRVLTGRMDSTQVIRGMRDAGAEVVRNLSPLTMPVETESFLQRVAFISSNGDEEIATFMAKACMAVGRDGTISIEDGRGVESSLEFKEGMEIDKGAASHAFFDRGSVERVIDGPLVACVNAPLTKLEDVHSILEESSQWPQNDLLLFATTIEGQALSTMVLNNSQEVVKSCAVIAPGFGPHQASFLQDIAAVAGASYISPDKGDDFRKWDPEWFGSFRKVTVGMKGSLLEAYDEASEEIQKRIEWVRAEGEKLTSDYDRDRLNERLAKLSGGFAILRVGGITEAALKERRARVEDALGSVQAALKGGVVPGGGTAYIAAGLASMPDCAVGEELDPGYMAGWDVVRRGLEAPMRTLARNAGFAGPALVAQYKGHEEKDPWHGWDATTGAFRSLREDPPVLDPLYVVSSVIETAVSVASTMLTTGVSITQV